MLGHGGGGQLSAELIEHLFLPAFGRRQLGPARRLRGARPSAARRLAFTTDSFVVSPLFFPGGNIGDLAVNGTVNDLAMSGAQPLSLSRGFMLEEGLPLDELGAIAAVDGPRPRRGRRRRSSPATPRSSDAATATGSSSTPPASGVVPDGVDIRPERARPGDVVIVCGPIGVHGMAIMSVREGLEFGTEIATRQRAAERAGGGDARPPAPDVHVLRDPTRGGLAAVAERDRRAPRGVGIELDERDDPGARRRSRAPASSSAWTRCTSPTRASWWRSSPRERRRARCWPRCAAHPLAPAPR